MHQIARRRTKKEKEETKRSRETGLSGNPNVSQGTRDHARACWNESEKQHVDPGNRRQKKMNRCSAEEEVYHQRSQGGP